MEHWEAVAAAVRTRLLELEVSPAELAQRAGVSTKTIYNVLNRDAVPHWLTLAKVSRGLWWRTDTLKRIAEGGAAPGPDDDVRPEDATDQKLARIEDELTQLRQAVQRLVAELGEDRPSVR